MNLFRIWATAFLYDLLCCQINTFLTRLFCQREKTYRGRTHILHSIYKEYYYNSFSILQTLQVYPLPHYILDPVYPVMLNYLQLEHTCTERLLFLCKFFLICGHEKSCILKEISNYDSKYDVTVGKTHICIRKVMSSFSDLVVGYHD